MADSINNPYDNSEAVAINTKKDLFAVASTGTAQELDEHIKYYKYLKMRAELESDDGKNIKVNGKDVSIQDLIPQTSEFEGERLRVLVLLNKLGADDPLVLSLQRDFGTNSLFELASEYANYSLGRSRGERLYAILNGKKDSVSLYDGLTADDTGKRADAKKALYDGSFTAGVKSRAV